MMCVVCPLLLSVCRLVCLSLVQRPNPPGLFSHEAAAGTGADVLSEEEEAAKISDKEPTAPEQVCYMS